MPRSCCSDLHGVNPNNNNNNNDNNNNNTNNNKLLFVNTKRHSMIEINLFFKKTKFAFLNSIYFHYKTPKKEVLIFC